MTNHGSRSIGHTYQIASVLIANQHSAIPPSQHRFFLDVAHAVARGQPELHEAVASILARNVDKPELLDVACVGSAQPHNRHLLHEGPDHCVVAIVWMPGQMSPIHSHRSWCALGVHAGELVETSFKPRKDPEAVAGKHLRVTGCRHLRANMVSSSPASDTAFHRVANLSAEPAISIHVYGVPFDRLADGLNQVWRG